jgi:hypothetical protein
MTATITLDRNYLRMLSDSEIVRLGYESGHELAVAMAERLAELEDMADKLADARKDIAELETRVDLWQEEANHLRALLDSKA